MKDQMYFGWRRTACGVTVRLLHVMHMKENLPEDVRCVCDGWRR